MKFKVVSGTFFDGEKSFGPGSIVESSVNLEKVFGRKFSLIPEAVAPVKKATKKTAEKVEKADDK